MGIVGNFDLLSSINTCITAKLLPLYEGLAISDGDYSEILNEINLPETPSDIIENAPTTEEESIPEEDSDISENDTTETFSSEESETEDTPHAILSEEELEEINKKIITDQKIKHIVDRLNDEDRGGFGSTGKE